MAEGKIATHSDPVWRERANYIIRADLSPHGLADSFEQLWTYTDDQRAFQLCCIPFFTYGLALGDVVRWDQPTSSVAVEKKSGRRVIRVAFTDRDQAEAKHADLHGQFVHAGCLVEFSSDGYAAIDIANPEQAQAITGLLAAQAERSTLTWEWGAT
jgi:hypothetical protein